MSTTPFPTPLNLREPDRKALREQSSWVPRRALLEAAFGGPVPGIAPDPDEPPMRVVFEEEEFEVLPNGKQAMACVHGLQFEPGEEKDDQKRAEMLWSWDRAPHRITFDPQYLSKQPSFTNTLMGHEGLHVCQFEDALTDALIAPHRLGANPGESTLSGHGPVLEKIIASLETPAQTAARHAQLAGSLGEKSQNLALPPLPYLNNLHLYHLMYIEMEARMGQVLFGTAYQQNWKRLPQTRSEVESILSLFLPVPDLTRYPHGHPDFPVKQYYDFFHPAGNIAHQTGYILGRIAAKFPDPHREAFYTTIYPEIYASFAERCGDYDIRAKLGLEPGIPRGRLIGRQLRYEIVAPEDKCWSPAQWTRHAARAEAETLPGLVRLAVESQNDAALPILLEAWRQHPSFDPAAVRTPEVEAQKFLLSPKNRTLLDAAFRREAGAQKNPAWEPQAGFCKVL